MFMEKVKSDLHTWLNTATALITIFTVVFFGGALWSTVYQNHEPRLSAIESKGSTALQRHEAYDDERVTNMRNTMAEIKADLKEIKEKLDKLNSKTP